MNDLIVVEELNPIDLYKKGGMKLLVEQIKEKALSIVPDVSTASGRREIASLAHKVARSKTLLDNMGKELKKDAMKLVREVDAERKFMRDELDKLKEEVRRPLTEYEEKEKRRIAGLEKRVNEIIAYGVIFDDMGRPYPSGHLKEQLAKLKSISIDDSFEEFAPQAAIEKDKAMRALEEAITVREREEEEARELERLRKEREERERKEREKRIAEEAARRAKEEAEVRAREEIERKEREKQEAIQREKERAEREKAELIRKQEEERRAEEERKRREEEARRQREADEKHRKAVEDNIKAALKSIGINKTLAEKLISAINADEVPHMIIVY